MVYGVAKDSAGIALPNTWVQLTQSGKSTLVLTEIDGSYLVYDGQLCTGDGLVSCSTGTSWTFANGTSNGTLAILGNGPTRGCPPDLPESAYTKHKIMSNGSTVVAQTTTHRRPPSASRRDVLSEGLDVHSLARSILPERAIEGRSFSEGRPWA